MQHNLHIQHANIYLGGEPQAGAILSELKFASMVPNVGEMWPEQGGVNGGMMPARDGVPAYYLIVPPDPEAEAESLEFGGSGKLIEGLSDWDGLANTKLLLASGIKHPAAEFCASRTIAGFNDLYLAARREMRMLFVTCPQLFKPKWYWTSSQSSAYDAFCQLFGDGDQDNDGKDLTLRVRAVRRFFVN